MINVLVPLCLQETMTNGHSEESTDTKSEGEWSWLVKLLDIPGMFFSLN